MRGVFTISYSFFFSPSTSEAECLSAREAFFKRTSAATLIQFHSVCKNINGCIFIEKYDRLAWVGQDMSRSGFENVSCLGLTKFIRFYFPELNSCANTEFDCSKIILTIISKKCFVTKKLVTVW